MRKEHVQTDILLNQTTDGNQKLFFSAEGGKKAPRDIQYAPERDIAIALSEYAPGRFVTIDKKILK